MGKGNNANRNDKKKKNPRRKCLKNLKKKRSKKIPPEYPGGIFLLINL
jgi:hypothetical protein